MESKPFEIVAVDRSSAAFLAETGRHFHRWIAEYFPDQSGRTIRIEIRDSGSRSGEPAYRIYRSAGDRFTLALSWNEDLNERDLALGLTRVYLLQNMRGCPLLTPGHRDFEWIILGLAGDFLDTLYPGYFHGLDADSMPPLREMVDKKVEWPVTGPAFQRYYTLWLYRVERAGGWNSLYETLKNRGAEEVESGAAPSAVLHGPGSPENIELHWRTYLHHVSDRQRGMVDSPGESDLGLRDLMDFKIFVEGEEQALELRDLWDYRNLSWLEMECGRRLSLIKAKLPTVNPLYHNAYHSLGVALESMKSAEWSRYSMAIKQFREDRGRAREVSEWIRIRKPGAAAKSDSNIGEIGNSSPLLSP